MKEIPLTKGAVAIVDDEMYEYLSQFNWYLHSEGYAIREYKKDGKKVRVRMHREIMGTPDGMDTDHINGNRVDNRRENLRICTRSENLMNTTILKSNNASGYKGVSWWSHGKLWRAEISLGNRKRIVKYRKTAKEAAIAYNEMAIEYYGEFARLNKID